MANIGDKIKIISMDGEPHYSGKEGKITFIGRDFDNELYYRGTWGGCSVYPFKDDIQIINDYGESK